MIHLPKQNYSKYLLVALAIGFITYLLIPNSASNLAFVFFDASNPSVFDGLMPFGHYKIGFAFLVVLAVSSAITISFFSLILSLMAPKPYIEESDKKLVVQRYVDYPALINRNEFEDYLKSSQQSELLVRPTKADYAAAITAVNS